MPEKNEVKYNTPPLDVILAVNNAYLFITNDKKMSIISPDWTTCQDAQHPDSTGFLYMKNV